MTNPRKATVVDGYTVVKLVRRTVAGGDEPAPSPSPVPQKKPPAADGEKKLHIDHTVVPSKHPIRCYQCGYEFFLTARLPKTYCPKCRIILELTDYTIEGEWSESLKTAGMIRIAPQAVVKAGELLATDVVLEGRVEGGRVEAYRRLELGPGAVYDPSRLRAPDLRVAPGAEIRLKEQVSFRDVEILGSLDARLRASGRVTVHAGALLIGELESAHLVVEEGGGLRARVRVEPGSAARI